MFINIIILFSLRILGLRGYAVFGVNFALWWPFLIFISSVLQKKNVNPFLHDSIVHKKMPLCLEYMHVCFNCLQSAFVFNLSPPTQSARTV